MSRVFGEFIYILSFCVEIHEKDMNNHQFTLFHPVFLRFASFSGETAAIHIISACFVAYLSKMSWNNRAFFDFHLKFWYNIFIRKNKRISKRCFPSKAQNICPN